VEGDGLPFEPRNPRPNGNVGNGIIARYIFRLAEPLVEYAPQPAGFLGIALLCVHALARIEFHEMVNLAEERSRAPHLQHQPLDHAPMSVRPLSVSTMPGSYCWARWRESRGGIGGLCRCRSDAPDKAVPPLPA